MRYPTATAIALTLALSSTFLQPRAAFAQATPSSPGTSPPPASPAPTPPPAATSPPPAPVTSPPVAVVPPPTPSLPSKGLDGLDVFSSDGQQVGKVVKVNMVSDGKVKDVEVHSPGFFGFFSSAYILPAEKLTLKGGRLDVAMTSEQVKKSSK